MQTEFDDSVRLRVWHGTVQVTIHHHDEHVTFNVPRLSYLPILYPKLRHLFGVDAVQLACGEVILKDHLPVGLLYDLHSGLNLTITEGQSLELSSTVWNSLKQSTCLKFGSIRHIQNLKPDEAGLLRESILKLQFVEYFTTAKSIMSVSGCKNVPLRIYFSQDVMVQGLIPNVKGSTIYNALNLVCPKLAKLGEDVVAVTMHGCRISWSLLLIEVLEECAYADGWINLCVSRRETSSTSVEEE